MAHPFAPVGDALLAVAVDALLGFVQWVAAGTIAPIAGLGGAGTAVLMAVIMVVSVGASMVGLLGLARPGTAG